MFVIVSLFVFVFCSSVVLNIIAVRFLPSSRVVSCVFQVPRNGREGFSGAKASGRSLYV